MNNEEISYQDLQAENSRLKEQIKENQSLFQEIINLSSSFIFAKDQRLKFCVANASTAAVYGTTVENIIGKSDADFNFHEDELESFKLDDLKVIEQGAELHRPEEYITDSKGKKRWLHTIKRLFKVNDHTKYVIGVAHDITYRKELEDIIRQTREKLLKKDPSEVEALHSQGQLLRRERMIAIGGLASSIAHELNNPLGVISLVAQNALETATPENAYSLLKKSCEKILTNSQRSASIIRSILAYSRQESSQRQLCDLKTLINKASKFACELYPELQGVISFNCPEELPKLEADPLGIEQVCVNILKNAFESKNNDHPLVIEISAAIDGQDMTLKFKDNGCGIAKHELEKIFHPLVRMNNKTEGIGFGLTIVRDIINNHGGRISIESVPNIGTLLEIRLPLMRIDANG